MQPCECINENFVCHPVEGCVCRRNYGGENCEEELMSSIKGMINIKRKWRNSFFNCIFFCLTGNKSEGGAGAGSVAAGVIVALILVVIIILIVFYYRRRVENLKTEIAHVQYIADPHSAPGKYFLAILILQDI